MSSFQRSAPYLAVVTLIALLAITAYQHSEIARLEQALEESASYEGATRGRSGSSATTFEELRRIDQKIVELEAELAATRRALGQDSPRLTQRQGDTPGSARADLLSSDGMPAGTMPLVLEDLKDEDSPVRAELAELVRTERERQQTERQMERRDRMMEEAEEEFAEFAQAHNITSQQQARILPKIKEERAQIFDLFRARRDGNMSREEIREQIQTIRAETDSAVLEELDATQQDAYRERREEEAARWNNRGGRGGGGGRGRGQSAQ